MSEDELAAVTEAERREVEDRIRVMGGAGERVTICLAGDVMTGRGIDQILGHPGEGELREPHLTHAREYVELAAGRHGAVPTGVDPAYVWGEALALLRKEAPDASIANLETSVTVSGDFWPRKDVHYRMHPANVGCLAAPGFDVYALANNHLLDFGRRGLEETLRVLDDAGIGHAGAGADLAEARRSARVALPDGGVLHVFACGSESSGIPRSWAAEDDRAGVELLPSLSPRVAETLAARVLAVKRPGDLVLVSIHWGSNWGDDIPAAQRAFAHALVDGGVDLVHGHSSHHARAIEVYRGRLILYGCGDLVTDYEGIRGYERWRGDLGALYLATVSTRDGSLRALRLAPTRMERLRLTLAGADDVRWLRDRLSAVSAPFGVHLEQGTDGLLVVLWEEPSIAR